MTFLRNSATAIILSAISLGALGACSDSESDVGSARMALRATSAQNIQYRLRDAVFEITGPETKTLSSESYNRNAAFISVDLHAGDYDIELMPGSWMEYSHDNQDWFLIEHTLVSDNPVSTSVVTGESTDVIYRFSVDGNLITFGDGEVNIGIEVEERTSRCAEHFVESESECWGVTDSYSCIGEDQYPPDSVCPAGTTMSNLWGYTDGGAPHYRCYVGQQIGATESPPGCPITNASCIDGWHIDPSSALDWHGGGSSWGCHLTCTMDENPHDTIPQFPCIEPGYIAGGGGGGETCCVPE